MPKCCEKRWAGCSTQFDIDKEEGDNFYTETISHTKSVLQNATQEKLWNGVKKNQGFDIVRQKKI